MITLRESHEKFLKDLKDKGRANATIIAYGKDIEQLIEHAEAQGKAAPQKLEKEDLKGFVKTLEEKDYTPKSVSRKINAVRTYFKFLQDEGMVDNDPSASLRHPKIEIKPPRILSKMEYRALRDACRQKPRIFAIVELLLQTGVRIGELRRLKLSDVELGENGKTGKLRIAARNKNPERVVPLNQPAQEALQKYLKGRPKGDEGTIFITRTGRPFLIRNVRSTINRYFKKAGVEDVTVNDLRNTFIATHLSRGVPLTTVSRLVGHRRLTTTERYLKYVEQPEEEVQLSKL